MKKMYNEIRMKGSKLGTKILTYYVITSCFVLAGLADAVPLWTVILLFLNLIVSAYFLSRTREFKGMMQEDEEA
jgi:hypothetical protein